MRANGINYDAGIIGFGANTHPRFDPERVAADMLVIRDELHCNAVRVTGDDPDRIETAARCAAAAGLEVWVSPFTGQLTTTQLMAVLVDCAERAERLRRAGAEVVFVTGAELSLFTIGFLPGATFEERFETLMHSAAERRAELVAEASARINEFLSRAVTEVRKRFGGKLCYASIWLERVDWAPFDFVGVDAYRTAAVADQYLDGMRTLVAAGKPVAVTEFGCGTFAGAADRGARCLEIVAYDGTTPVGLDGDYTRDEPGQAGCLRELLAAVETAGVDSAFVYTYANFHLPHRDGPRADLDLAGYGVVRIDEADQAREPKAAFAAVADSYARSTPR